MATEIKTDVWGDGSIEQSVYQADRVTGVMRRVAQTIVSTQDAQVKEALVKLGWVPPEEATALREEIEELSMEIRVLGERDE